MSLTIQELIEARNKAIEMLAGTPDKIFVYEQFPYDVILGMTVNRRNYIPENMVIITRRPGKFGKFHNPFIFYLDKGSK